MLSRLRKNSHCDSRFKALNLLTFYRHLRKRCICTMVRYLCRRNIVLTARDMLLCEIVATLWHTIPLSPKTFFTGPKTHGARSISLFPGFVDYQPRDVVASRLISGLKSIVCSQKAYQHTLWLRGHARIFVLGARGSKVYTKMLPTMLLSLCLVLINWDTGNNTR